jgi:hypothetical protein
MVMMDLKSLLLYQLEVGIPFNSIMTYAIPPYGVEPLKIKYILFMPGKKPNA